MPYVDALCAMLEKLIRERMADPEHTTDVLGEVVPQPRTVLAQAGHRHPGVNVQMEPGAALAVVAAARLAQEHLVSIERAAAILARDGGVTLRRLALAAGITERAAAERYRRPAGLST
ncbi:hypothetical protein [Actinokineospora sp. HUAS TT18]|uniref:hypothetical protein n=1 Tax=Actinokineospora sp. HUAS TT18 TaxID=3447451 RepID=UPI003F51BCCB